jgi:hypothetical protein
LTAAQAQQILYIALATPIGLLLSASKPEAAVQRLYAERKKLGDPELGGLQFRRCVEFDGGNLVVTKGEVKMMGAGETLAELGL